MSKTANPIKPRTHAPDRVQEGREMHGEEGGGVMNLDLEHLLREFVRNRYRAAALRDLAIPETLVTKAADPAEVEKLLQQVLGANGPTADCWHRDAHRYGEQKVTAACLEVIRREMLDAPRRAKAEQAEIEANDRACAKRIEQELKERTEKPRRTTTARPSRRRTRTPCVWKTKMLDCGHEGESCTAHDAERTTLCKQLPRPRLVLTMGPIASGRYCACRDEEPTDKEVEEYQEKVWEAIDVVPLVGVVYELFAFYLHNEGIDRRAVPLVVHEFLESQGLQFLAAKHDTPECVVKEAFDFLDGAGMLEE